MKKITIILVLVLFKTNLYSKELNILCLISTSNIHSAELDDNENSRFAGKELKFVLNYGNNPKENTIRELSNDFNLPLITGITGQEIKFFEIKKNGVKYESQIDVDDNGKVMKYNFNNFIRIENGNAKLLFALIQEEGSSVNRRFNIQIPCKNTNYTAKEISNAKEPYKAFGLNSPEFKKKIEELRKKGIPK